MLRDVGPVLVAVLGGATLLTLGAARTVEPPGEVSAAPAWVARAGPPVGPAEPPEPSATRQRTGGQPYLDWARAMGPRVGIPVRALSAYAEGERAAAATTPGCRLSWVTLAGIGAVESAHGTAGPARVGRDGVVRPPVFGPVLDGSAGTAAVADTDGGRHDGHPRWDRAMGPMQFIPSTWARWQADGDGDGRTDPHQFDDAAVAAARYLCASGVDTGTGAGWSQAVFSYNHATDYVRRVYAAARWYAARSR